MFGRQGRGNSDLAVGKEGNQRKIYGKAPEKHVNVWTAVSRQFGLRSHSLDQVRTPYARQHIWKKLISFEGSRGIPKIGPCLSKLGRYLIKTDPY